MQIPSALVLLVGGHKRCRSQRRVISKQEENPSSEKEWKERRQAEEIKKLTPTKMKFVISEKFGTAYSKNEDGELCFHPLSHDGSFDSADGGIVETWEDMDVYEKNRIIKSLA